MAYIPSDGGGGGGERRSTEDPWNNGKRSHHVNGMRSGGCTIHAKYGWDGYGLFGRDGERDRGVSSGWMDILHLWSSQDDHERERGHGEIDHCERREAILNCFMVLENDRPGRSVVGG